MWLYDTQFQEADLKQRFCFNHVLRPWSCEKKLSTLFELWLVSIVQLAELQIRTYESCGGIVSEVQWSKY